MKTMKLKRSLVRCLLIIVMTLRSLNVSGSNAPFSATRTETMHNISGKKKFILIFQENVHRCIQSNLYVTALNKRSLYITVTGQLPKIFSCLPQQRVAVLHRFDYVTINKRLRYSYTFPETYTLGARDSSCALDVGPCTPEIKPLGQLMDKSDKYWENQSCYPLDRG